MRPARAAGSATLEVRSGGSGSFKKLTTVRYDKRGYLTTSARYKKNRQYRLSWTAPDGTVYRGAPTRAYDY